MTRLRQDCGDLTDKFRKADWCVDSISLTMARRFIQAWHYAMRHWSIGSQSSLDYWRPSRTQSVKVFLDQLPLDEVLSAVDIALSRKDPIGKTQDEEAFRYFCGICWSKIKGKEKPQYGG